MFLLLTLDVMGVDKTKIVFCLYSNLECNIYKPYFLFSDHIPIGQRSPLPSPDIWSVTVRRARSTPGRWRGTGRFTTTKKKNQTGFNSTPLPRRSFNILIRLII